MRDQQSTEGNITEAPFAGDEQVAILEAFLLAEKIYAAYKDEGNQVVADLTERFLRDYPVELLTELLEEIGRSEQVGLVWSSVNTGQSIEDISPEVLNQAKGDLLEIDDAYAELDFHRAHELEDAFAKKYPAGTLEAMRAARKLEQQQLQKDQAPKS